MNSMIRSATVWLACLAFFPAYANSTMITHSSSGVIFLDTFESQTVGTRPSTAGISSGIGAWEYPTSVQGIVVGDGSATDDPPTFEGENFLRMDRRPATAFNFNHASAVFAPQSSGTLTASYAFYVPSGVGLAQVAFNTTSSFLSYVSIYNFYGDGTIGFNNGSANFDTDATFSTDTWNVFDHIYNIDTGEFSGRLNGQSIAGDQGASGITITRYNYLPGLVDAPGSVFFVDAVPIPEPSSVFLMAAGLVGLGLTRWIVTRRVAGAKSSCPGPLGLGHDA